MVIFTWQHGKLVKLVKVTSFKSNKMAIFCLVDDKTNKTYYINDVCVLITTSSFDIDASQSLSGLEIGEDQDCQLDLDCIMSGWDGSEVLIY